MRENMHTQKSNDLVLISITSPLLCGIYKQGECIESFSYECKTLDALTDLCEKIKSKNIARVFYAKGPGSFTAIKLTHIFLQTLQITQNLELYSLDSFYFNHASPIRAFGNQYFIKEKQKIVLKSFEEIKPSGFALPQKLRVEDFGRENEPLYILPPV